MSSVSEFDNNLKLLNEALVKLKPYYNNHQNKSESILDVIVELQALAIYVEKGSANQSDIPPEDNNFDRQVWNVLKDIGNKAMATDLARSQFNELFTRYQNDILSMANMNV